MQMKKIITFIIIIFVAFSSRSTNYYISSTVGNDSNNGMSESSPWKTIDKINSMSDVFLPGDNIYFKSNDIFKGSIVLTKSGSPGSPITIGKYDTGNLPIITGRIDVTNWVNIGNNLWSATQVGNGIVSDVYINGEQQTLGRFPKRTTFDNFGYNIYTSHDNQLSITDPTLSNFPSWIGAECVIRTAPWFNDRLRLVTQLNGTLTFDKSLSYTPVDDSGYFFQHHVNCLTEQGEWMYDFDTKVITLYSSVNPNTLDIKTTGYDSLISTKYLNYITIENLKWDSSSKYSIHVWDGNYITIINNEIENAGEIGIKMRNCTNSIISYNKIKNTHGNAISQTRLCNNNEIIGNIVSDIALIPGRDARYTNPSALELYGNDQIIHSNKIDNVGYIGISFRGENVRVYNNVISNYGYVYEDGGGIYTWNGDSSSLADRITYVYDNIVYNGKLDSHVAAGGNEPQVNGIYMDDNTRNVIIENNTVYNMSGLGIYAHAGNHISILNNNVYNTLNGISFYHGNTWPSDESFTYMNIQNNTIIAKTNEQRILTMNSYNHNLIGSTNIFDNNIYSRPLNEFKTIGMYFNYGETYGQFSLQEWQSDYGFDLHSKLGPIALLDYVIDSVVSDNLITNPTFNTDISQWSSWAKYSNSKVEYDSNSLHLYWTSITGNADASASIASNVQIELDVNKTYSLKFKIKSSADDVPISTNFLNSSYSEIATTKYYTLGSEYVELEQIFKPITSAVDVRFYIWVTESSGDVWLDNIELVEVESTPIEVDDYIKLIVNETSINKTFEIGKSYVDVQGHLVDESITLQPYTSMFLFKYEIETPPLNVDDSISYSNGVLIYPTVIIDEFNIDITDNSLGYATIYNTSGQLMKIIKLIDLNGVYNISELSTGMYFIRVPNNSEYIVKKIIKN